MDAQQVVLTYEPVSVDRLADELRGIQRELADVVEAADSFDGLVAVSVNARGDLLNLELDPRVRNLDSRSLSEQIQETYRVARAAADARAYELTMHQLKLTRDR